ncbi:MAG TPA: UBP-type zinc finger domain-containing protein [Euzebyales bacterium]|nr:UBP-type zinc finger domain-containing protein [Euzebyales bacterium]
MTDVCSHLDQITDPPPRADGCEDCLAIGGTWLHLRRCMSCGHIGCCDSSPNRHATAHAVTVPHPVVQSFEPGEDWLWCYADSVAFEVPALMPSPSHS